MNRAVLGGIDLAGFVHRFADDVDDAPEGAVADRNRDRLSGVLHLLTADQTVGGVHGDGAHGGLAQMLRDFQHQPATVIVGFQRIENLRQMSFELDVHHGAGDLGHLTGLVAARRRVHG